LKPADFEDFCKQIMAIMRGEFQFNDRALYAILKALDTSIVRADVDFLACQDVPALLKCFPPIWRSYVKSGAWEKSRSPWRQRFS